MNIIQNFKYRNVITKIMEPSKKACMIYSGGKNICIYPSEKTLNVIGKKYTLLIIALLGNEKYVKFNEILRNLGSPRANIISVRLKELESLGFVRKRILSNVRPISVEYALTKDGRKLRKLILPLLSWIEKKGLIN